MNFLLPTTTNGRNGQLNCKSTSSRSSKTIKWSSEHQLVFELLFSSSFSLFSPSLNNSLKAETELIRTTSFKICCILKTPDDFRSSLPMSSSLTTNSLHFQSVIQCSFFLSSPPLCNPINESWRPWYRDFCLCAGFNDHLTIARWPKIEMQQEKVVTIWSRQFHFNERRKWKRRQADGWTEV